MIRVDGELRTIRSVLREHGIPEGTYRTRLRRGWPPGMAMVMPSKALGRGGKAASLCDEKVRHAKALLDKREAVLELMERLTFPAIAEQVGTTPQIVQAIDAGRTYKFVGEFE